MPKRGPNKRVTFLIDYFDYNLFGIKLVNALNDLASMPNVPDLSPTTKEYSHTHNQVLY
jgi:hypothetical protein